MFNVVSSNLTDFLLFITMSGVSWVYRFTFAWKLWIVLLKHCYSGFFAAKIVTIVTKVRVTLAAWYNRLVIAVGTCSCCCSPSYQERQTRRAPQALSSQRRRQHLVVSQRRRLSPMVSQQRSSRVTCRSGSWNGRRLPSLVSTQAAQSSRAVVSWVAVRVGRLIMLSRRDIGWVSTTRLWNCVN